MYRDLGEHTNVESRLLWRIMKQDQQYTSEDCDAKLAKIFSKMDCAGVAKLLLTSPMVTSCPEILNSMKVDDVAAIVATCSCTIAAGTLLCGLRPKKATLTLALAAFSNGKPGLQID
jgi:hypothetical protein